MLLNGVDLNLAMLSDRLLRIDPGSILGSRRTPMQRATISRTASALAILLLASVAACQEASLKAFRTSLESRK